MSEETTNSLASHAQPVDHRGQNRTTTIFRPVLIETEEFAGFCLVRNLSPNGLMGKVYTQFADDLAVTVYFNDEIFVSGKIVWSDNETIGLHFYETIDVSELLGKLATKVVGDKVNRAPRLPIQCNAALEIGRRMEIVEVLDISQRGIKVRVPFLAPDEEVLVWLEGLPPRKALVRWTQFGTVGINFIRPLGFDELAEWVINQQVNRSHAISAEGQGRAAAQ